MSIQDGNLDADDGKPNTEYTKEDNMLVNRQQAIDEIVDAQSRGMYDMELKDYADKLRDGIRGIANLDNKELAEEYHSTLLECDDPDNLIEVSIDVERKPMDTDKITRTLTREEWGQILEYIAIGRDACDEEEDAEEIADIELLKASIIG